MKKIIARPKNRFVLVICLAVGALLLLATPVAAQETEPVYGDLAENIHAAQIGELATTGILTGTECAPTAFCPDEPVTRETAAVWLVRLLEGNEPPIVDQSRFNDVDVAGKWATHIERLAELEVTSGCGRQAFCPNGHVSRRHLAVFLVRAYGLTPAAAGGVFADVADSNWAAGHIGTAVSVGLLEACSLEEPLYCPERLVTRAEMAAFLMQARRLERLFKLPVDQPRQVYAGRDQQGALWIRWRAPWHGGFLPLTKYIVQWRSSSEQFDEARQAEMLDTSKLWHVVEDVAKESLYAVKIIAVNAVGAGPSSRETMEASLDNKPFLPSAGAAFFNEERREWLEVQRSRFWRHVEEELLPSYEQQYPWLRETWNRVKHKADLDFCQQACDSDFSAEIFFRCHASRSTGNLRKCQIYRLLVGTDVLEDNSLIVHELGHALTLDSMLLEESASLATAMLYFVDLADQECPARELYADTLEALVVGPGSSWYWRRCPHLPVDPSKEALAVVEQALVGETSDWFARKYRQSNGSLNHQAVWADVAQLSERARAAVVYGLRQQFGGYCDEAALAAALEVLEEDKIALAQLAQPWRDGGCQPESA